MLQKKSQFVLVMLLLVAAITRPIWHPQNVHICVCMCVCNCVFIATIHNYRKSFEYDEAHRANKVQSKEEHRMPRGSHDGVEEKEREGERPRECMPIKRVCVCGGSERESETERAEKQRVCVSLAHAPTSVEVWRKAARTTTTRTTTIANASNFWQQQQQETVLQLLWNRYKTKRS